MWLWKDTAANWYHHKPDPVCHTEKYKLSWDFKIQLGHHIEHNKPDIVLLNKEDKSCIIVDQGNPTTWDLDLTTWDLEFSEHLL